MIDFVAGDDQAGFSLRQGAHCQHRAVLTGKARGPLDGGAFHDQGDGPGGANEFPLLHHGMIMEGGAHHLIHQIKRSQGLDAHLEQTVPIGIEIDFSFPGIILPGHSLAGQGPGQDGRSFVLMDFIGLEIDDVEVVFPQALHAADIVLADGVTLAEGGTLEFSRSNLGDIMCQFGPDGFFQLYGFNHLDDLMTTGGSLRPTHLGSVNQVFSDPVISAPSSFLPRQSLWPP